MTFHDRGPDCAGVAGLIQPYVDGELSASEQEAVLAHLDGCAACRSAVQEQQCVRAALRDLEQEVAPQSLRARVLAELDRLDRARPAEHEPWLAGLWGRGRALLRGGLLLVPAGAAAVGLFFLVREGVESQQLATQTTSMIEPLPRASEDTEPTESARRLEAVEGVFPVQFVDPDALPPDVQLVGAGNAESSQAMVRLRQGDRDFVDRQRPAARVRPSGQEQVFRGRHYHLSRDAGGRAMVQFELAGVLHELTWEDASGRIGAPVDLGENEFSRLVELADHLQSRPMLRD